MRDNPSHELATPEERIQARHREAILRSLVTRPSLSEADIQVASEQMGVGRAYLYRLLAAYRLRPKASTLLAGATGRSSGLHLLPLTSYRLSLFCIPYAGGNASIYKDWTPAAPEGVEVCPVELPGRGRLFKQPFADSLEVLAETIREAITPYTARPYAIFGHSMGALLAYEVTAQLRSAGHPEPSALFLSGRCPPFGGRTGTSVSRLPDPQFLEHLRKLAGTPQEILASEELMQIFLPVLRSDFSLCEEYEPQEAQIFTMPVTVMSGDEDEETSEREMQRWRRVTTGAFTSRRYPGDHFFMKNPLVMQDVYGDLEKFFLKADVGPRHG